MQFGQKPRDGLSDRCLVVSGLAKIFATAKAYQCLGSETHVFTIENHK